MGEPLFDGMTAAIVFLGAAAVIVLRSASDGVANAERLWWFNFVGHLLLGSAVSLLLFRWIDAVTDLPAGVRPNAWRSGALSVACGIGLVAVVKAGIGVSITSRVRYFVIAAVSGAISLFLAAAWDWALVLLAMLSAGIALTLWRSAQRGSAHAHFVHPATDDEEPQREPALVLIVSTLLLLLLLGTWQHVIENETQRKTRSPRYSAWPRATALRDAWERTGWTAKPGDDDSTHRVADIASREQRIALGLGSLLLIVAMASRCRTSREPTTSEADHAG